jgi:tetratricopeptide (TPR) repeat protein
MDLGRINTDMMYENLMNRFVWGNIQDSTVYLDENNRRMLSNFRNSFARLGEALMQEGKTDSAKAVLDRCLQLMPHDRVPYSYFMLPVVKSYFALGETRTAKTIMEKIFQAQSNELQYFLRLSPVDIRELDYEFRLRLHVLNELAGIAREHGQEEMAKDINTKFNSLFNDYTGIMQ